MGRAVKVGGIDDLFWREEAAPAPVGPRRSRRALVAAIAALFLVACYCIIAASLSRQDYGTFAFWSTPKRIDYCGRRYYLGGTMRGTPASLTAPVGTRWQTLGRTFLLRPIHAARSGPTRVTQVCAMELYVAKGNHTYAAYSPSGGP